MISNYLRPHRQLCRANRQQDLQVWGAVGAINISAGAGDYLNVFNAITQMPKGARTYLHHFSSFWYVPEK